MGNMTLRELAEHIYRLQKEDKKIDLNAEIYAAEVVAEGDSEFPQGTILFGCKSMGEDKNHILSIYPKRLGRLQ